MYHCQANSLFAKQAFKHLHLISHIATKLIICLMYYRYDVSFLSEIWRWPQVVNTSEHTLLVILNLVISWWPQLYNMEHKGRQVLLLACSEYIVQKQNQSKAVLKEQSFIRQKWDRNNTFFIKRYPITWDRWLTVWLTQGVNIPLKPSVVHLYIGVHWFPEHLWP